MAEQSIVPERPLSTEAPKRRKLKHPRTNKACAFCRKRKTRCTGTQPCELCVREEVTCEYASERPSEGRSTPARASSTVAVTSEDVIPSSPREAPGERRNVVQSRADTDKNTSVHQGNPKNPSAAFAHDHHVGPTSGVSFLYHRWKQGQEYDYQNDSSGSEKEDDAVNHQPPLAAYGDVPPLDQQKTASLPRPVFKIDHILDMLDRYFESVSPSLRFLHHPTVKKWASALVRQDQNLTAGRAAAVLLVCAQTLLQPFKSCDGGIVSSTGCDGLGVACSVQAKALLEQERGPPSLVSVQARVAMCLYLLSTFRLNECRYCFSFAVTIATALGLHRQNSTARVGCLEAECRKRTFWSLYILDGYLSVMLGRPRLLRTNDIDQPFPVNVDDHDLLSCVSLDHVPRHGNLEALIAQAKLAKLIALNDDQLYPLHPLSDHELLLRSGDMLDKLQQWHNELPGFLRPREETTIGQRTFERQNTILKLAAAHARILMTRRCLLIDFVGMTNDATLQPSPSSSTKRCVQECVTGVVTILNTVEALIAGAQCHSSHWSTQYIAVVALSTLYVLILHGVHLALAETITSIVDVNELLTKGKRCQDSLAALAPWGSQAKRHHLLLTRLRSKVEKYAARHDKGPSHSDQSGVEDHSGHGSVHAISSGRTMSMGDAHQHSHALLLPTSGNANTLQEDGPPDLAQEQSLANDLTVIPSIFTPNSSSDMGFDYMLEYGWGSLDTVGVPIAGYDFGGFNIPPYTEK